MAPLGVFGENSMDNGILDNGLEKDLEGGKGQKLRLSVDSPFKRPLVLLVLDFYVQPGVVDFFPHGQPVVTAVEADLVKLRQGGHQLGDFRNLVVDGRPFDEVQSVV